MSPWFHVGIDLIGPITPRSQQGNRYILTISDYFTKFVDAIALPDKEAISVASALFKVNVTYQKKVNFFMLLIVNFVGVYEDGSV